MLRRESSAVIRLLGVILLAFSTLAQAELKTGDGLPMPQVRWQSADGGTHHLNQQSSKAKILHFWAAWCVPCRKEMPEMLTWKKENPDIEVIPLSLDNRMAQAKHFIKKNQLDMAPLLVNEDDSDALNIPVLPYTIFVSADGRLLGYYAGMAPWTKNEFADQVRSLFFER